MASGPSTTSMIGLIASGVFYLKVDDRNRGTFEAEGSKPFTYRRKGQKKAVAMYEALDIGEDE